MKIHLVLWSILIAWIVCLAIVTDAQERTIDGTSGKLVGITFRIHDKVIFEFKDNGEVYHMGRLIDVDKEFVNLMGKFLQGQCKK